MPLKQRGLLLKVHTDSELVGYGSPILLSALSGIEHACLDILGKSPGMPVWRLPGGSCRDRVRVFASVGGPSPEAYAKHARKRVAEGYTALKCAPFPDPDDRSCSDI